MPQEHKTVFINYRRKTSAFIARAIFEHLRNAGYDVFMDVESIDSGTFDTIILNQIKARAHFLAILSPGCLEECSNPDDWVRREIEFAIEQGRNVVPVLAHGFKFEDYKDCLTGKLSELPRYSGLPLYHEYFDEGMARLRARYLKKPIHGSIQPAPTSDEPEVKRKVEKIAEQPTPTKDELVAEECFWSGLAKRRAGDLTGAIVDYTKAIVLNPQYTWAYNNRGIARRHQGDLEGAIADYSKAIKLNPQYAKAYNNRGEAYFVQRQYDLALTDFEKRLGFSPQNRWGMAGRAVTLHALGQIKEARALWRELIVIDTGYRNADLVGQELGWHPALIEEARKLIDSL